MVLFVGRMILTFSPGTRRTLAGRSRTMSVPSDLALALEPVMTAPLLMSRTDEAATMMRIVREVVISAGYVVGSPQSSNAGDATVGSRHSIDGAPSQTMQSSFATNSTQR